MKYIILMVSVAFILGAASSFAMAPWHFWPLLFIGLSGLFVLLHRAPSAKTAALYGSVFGLGYFGLGLAWIGNALLVEGNPYRWVWPLAVAGLPLILAPFTAMACGLYKRFCVTDRFRGLLAFTGFLSLAEIARGHLFTGFPWNLFGYAWADLLPLVQVAAIGTVYLLTALTVFWTALPGYICVSPEKKSHKIAAATLGVLLFAGLYAWGTARLNARPTAYNEDIAFAIIQPDILQSEKWNPALMPDNLEKQLALTRGALARSQTKEFYALWPETALAPGFLDSPRVRGMIGSLLAGHDGAAFLITGALRHDREWQTYHNSVLMIDRNGEISNIYDKSHLVPFGEYIPLENIFDLAPVVGFTGFVGGDGPISLETPGSLHYAPLVCYEIIFPGAILDRKATPPDVIVNVTNDAWYGLSAGPYQHFEQALFRAVEEGIPVIRSANTGFSGLIDPAGRVIAKSALFEEYVEIVKLPEKFAQTPKNIYRSVIVLLAVLIFFALLGLKGGFRLYKR